ACGWARCDAFACAAVAVVEFDRVLRQTMTLVDRIRSRLRRHLPQSLRRLVAQARRRANDVRATRHYEFTGEQLGAVPAPFVCVADVTQPIRRTAHFEGKMHNI